MSPEHALDLLPAPVYLTDADGIITYFNAAAAEAWGRRPEIGRTRWCGSHRLFTPTGEPVAHEDCPVAVSLRERRPVEDVPVVVERPDGTRRAFRPKIRLLRDDASGLTGAIVMSIEMSIDAAIDGNRLAAIVSSSADAVVSKDTDGWIVTWNEGAARILGYTEAEMVGQHITRIIPPNLYHEEDRILARIRRGERVDPFDTVRLAKDGRLVDLSVTVSPVRDGLGRVVGASKVARDITERKRHEETQKLLIDELNHRVRNTLATMKAISHQSMRRSMNPQDFVESFNGRLHALAHAHDLLVERQMRGVDLFDLVSQEVALAAPEEGRVTCTGGSVELPPQVAVQLALVLHELASNARRHGSLAQHGGKLNIDWELTGEDKAVLELCWKESGGRRVPAPVTAGLGLRMIEHSLAANEGQVDIQFEDDGLLCRLRLPLSAYGNGGSTPNDLRRGRETFVPEPVIEAEPNRLAGCRVLVVEDEALIAMELEGYLHELGCTTVGPVGSIDRACEIVGRGGFDVVLLDGNLNGRRSDAIAFDLAARNVPFAYSTGYGADSLPEVFRDRPLLCKPFKETEVRRVLLEIIGSAPATQ